MTTCAIGGMGASCALASFSWAYAFELTLAPRAAGLLGALLGRRGAPVVAAARVLHVHIVFGAK